MSPTKKGKGLRKKTKPQQRAKVRRPAKRKKAAAQRVRKPARASARPNAPPAARLARLPAAPARIAPSIAADAPTAFVQRIPLRTGHYALRHLGYAPGQQVGNGMPHGLVERLSGAVDIHTARAGDHIPALRTPNDTVMVTIGDGGGEIAIICLNHPGATGPGFRFILTPIALPEIAPAQAKAPPLNRAARAPRAIPAQAYPRAVPQPARPTTPGVSGVGHSELLGDVKYGPEEWVGGVGNVSLRLEGFNLHLEGVPPNLTLEYGVADARGKVSWSRSGALAGTRGRAQPIMGVAARIIGPGAAQWSVIYKCRFVGKPVPYEGRDGALCKADGDAAYLTAVHFSVVPRAVITASTHGEGHRGADGGPAPSGTLQAKILAHIERDGDRQFALGEWVGTPGSGRSIEGMQLTGFLPQGLNLEVGSPGVVSGELHWAPLAEFFGSRGKKVSLPAVAFRTAGSSKADFDLAVQIKFVDEPNVYSNPSPSEILQRFRTRRLEAVRLSVSLKE